MATFRIRIPADHNLDPGDGSTAAETEAVLICHDAKEPSGQQFVIRSWDNDDFILSFDRVAAGRILDTLINFFDIEEEVGDQSA